MSILDDSKSYYVKNSSVNSVIICIHMNILKMNFWIFFTNKYLFTALDLLITIHKGRFLSVNLLKFTKDGFML